MWNHHLNVVSVNSDIVQTNKVSHLSLWFCGCEAILAPALITAESPLCCGWPCLALVSEVTRLHYLIQEVPSPTVKTTPLMNASWEDSTWTQSARSHQTWLSSRPTRLWGLLTTGNLTPKHGRKSITVTNNPCVNVSFNSGAYLRENISDRLTRLIVWLLALLTKKTRWLGLFGTRHKGLHDSFFSVSPSLSLSFSLSPPPPCLSLTLYLCVCVCVRVC